MQNFRYVGAADPLSAAEAASSGGRIIAGGTDLLPLMKDRISTPAVLVDISRWPAGREIQANDDKIEIAALATLEEIGAHPEIQERTAALSDACRLSAAPQLRNMGTIGGNLLQATRCWYYRGPFNCWLKGGEYCYARNGENEQHSIFLNTPEESRCVSVHPSDPAVALLALDASVNFVTTQGPSNMPVADFYRLPTDEHRSVSSLPPGAVITGISIPARWTKSIYRKAMARATWTFALGSTAMAVRLDAGRIAEARVVLGGVAPVPLRVPAVESEMLGKSASDLDLNGLSTLLTEGANPLAKNGYKVQLIQGVFREAIAFLRAK